MGTIYKNKINYSGGGGNEVFVAVYGRTTYADVISAIDENKVILLDMPANHNLFNMTYVTYTNGGNAIMHAIFKMNDRPTLMTATLTPADQWTIVHTDLQEKLVSGTNIKTINNQSLLGSGNIDVSGGGGSDFVELINGVSTYQETLDAVSSNKRILFKPSKSTSRYLVLTASANDNKVNLNILIGIANNINKFIEYLTYTVDTSNQWSFVSTGYIRSVDVDSAMSDNSANAVQNKVIKSYVDAADTALQTQLGDLTALTTDEKTNLVGAINEVYEKSGEPFRVKNWVSSTLNVQVPACTEDIENTAIPKMDFTISDAEGADYQVVGMIAYELKDASGKRISCWPVCQFTGNGQKTLTLRWAGMGTTRKTATSINAWVLLKHR